MKNKYLRRFVGSCSVIRFEIYAFVCTIVGLVKTNVLFRKSHTSKLEIGVGSAKRKPGFITTDINLRTDYPFDLRIGLPFPSASLDFIYAEHVLEHFQFADLNYLLKECHRSLKPGGSLSVVVPDAGLYLNAYNHPEQFDQRRYCLYDFGLTYHHKLDYVNYIFYMGGHHRYMFDRESILFVLRDAGFAEVRLREYDPALDQAERRYESVYAVCSK